MAVKKPKGMKELEAFAWLYFRKVGKAPRPTNLFDKELRKFFARPEGKAYKAEVQELHEEFWNIIFKDFQRSELHDVLRHGKFLEKENPRQLTLFS